MTCSISTGSNAVNGISSGAWVRTVRPTILISVPRIYERAYLKIQETLAKDFGVEVEFRETSPICIERPIGVGAAVEHPPWPFIAAVGLRIEPAYSFAADDIPHANILVVGAQSDGSEAFMKILRDVQGKIGRERIS